MLLTFLNRVLEEAYNAVCQRVVTLCYAKNDGDSSNHSEARADLGNSVVKEVGLRYGKLVPVNI